MARGRLTKKDLEDIMDSQDSLRRQFAVGVYSGGQLSQFYGEAEEGGCCPMCKGSGLSGGIAGGAKRKSGKIPPPLPGSVAGAPLARPPAPTVPDLVKSKKVSLKQAVTASGVSGGAKAKKSVPESFGAWKSFFDDFRRNHPDMPFREAQKLASAQWKSM